MQVNVLRSKLDVGEAAARHAAQSLLRVLGLSETARIIAATGASQLDFLDSLTSIPGIDWQRVEMFHLDEYIGIPATHAASFRKYLMERFIQKTGIGRYHLLDGEQDPADVIRVIGRELKSAPVDIAFVGIGRDTQSSAFLSAPGIDELYSGVTKKTPSAPAIAARRRSTVSGALISSSSSNGGMSRRPV